MSLSPTQIPPKDEPSCGTRAVLQWGVTSSNQESAGSPERRTPREEEQFLCNEALRTGAFDAMSDNEWVAMCERAASVGRSATESGGLDEGVFAQ